MMAENEAPPNDVVEVELCFNSEMKIFQVPRRLFTYGGPTFSSLFSHPSVRAVKVRDVKIETFRIFVGWLMTAHWREGLIMLSQSDCLAWADTRKFCMAWASEDGDPIVCGVINADGLWTIAEAAIEMHIFAHTYDIPRLAQDAWDRLVWCNRNARVLASYFKKTFVSASTIHHLYENTQPDNYVRTWLVNGLRAFADIDTTDLTHLPQAFLVGVARDYKKRPHHPDDDVFRYLHMRYDCEFHEHATLKEEDECEVHVQA